MGSPELTALKILTGKVDVAKMNERFNTLVRDNQEKQWRPEMEKEMCPYCGEITAQQKESVRILREFSQACRTPDPEAFDNEIMRLCEEVRVHLLMEVDEDE